LRTNRIIIAVVLAALWTIGMLARASSLDVETVATALVVGIIVAFVMYWLLEKFGGRMRG
jgi:predicted exporter